MKLLFAYLIVFPVLAFSETLVLGAEGLKSNVNYLTDKHPFCSIIRDSVSHPLVRYNAERDSQEMLIAEKISITSQDTWEVRLKDGLLFSNRNPINVVDVQWSLEKCASRGVFPEDAQLSIHDNLLRIKYPSKKTYEDVVSNLSSCPVYERRSSEIFSQDLGYGTNIVSSALFTVSSFKDGKNIILQIVRQGHNLNLPQEVELRNMTTAEEGLSQLRSGILSVFFTEDKAVLEKAARDPTLKVLKCAEYNFAARADFEFYCSENFDLSSALVKQ